MKQQYQTRYEMAPPKATKKWLTGFHPARRILGRVSSEYLLLP
ncbi:Uncharacterised protein [Escherichia coli]|uniref:Uncharacterized protein n=1 Tax=Escherichia coli TaxID=562 RepID=A0A2X1J810_ECOLX|nr:Uncharacterised protein [Escherichia coli]